MGDGFCLGDMPTAYVSIQSPTPIEYKWLGGLGLECIYLILSVASHFAEHMFPWVFTLSMSISVVHLLKHAGPMFVHGNFGGIQFATYECICQ